MRPKVYELILQDLQAYPLWEYALEEEKTEGQDETTVRPKIDLHDYDPAHSALGDILVKTEFISRTGVVYLGLCTPSIENDLSKIQPGIVTPDGHVVFYSGIIVPGKAELEENYMRLKATREELFPLRFRSLVPVEGYFAMGTIPAFLYRSFDSANLIELV